MKGKTLLYVGVYVAVAYGGYYFFYSKNAFAKKIIGAGKYSRSIEDLKKFDWGFLKQWSMAASKNEPNFVYKGVVYLTEGGRRQK